MRMTFPKIFFGGMIVFTIMVMMVVFMPSLLWSPKPTVAAHPFTDREMLGRRLFWSNGCNYCHTQYVRKADNAMGTVSEAGDFAYDTPPLLGSERTGPDLTHIGRKRSEQWEIDHLRNPRAFSPMSIMPRFEFMTEDELRAVAAYLFRLGDRVALTRMVPSPASYAQSADSAPPTMVGTDSKAPIGWPSWNESGLQGGKEIYLTRCMTCHGCAGNGLGSYAGTLIVTPADFRQAPFKTMPEDQWFWHVSEGVQGSVMPPWKKALTEAERWQVIRYIRTIFARPAMRAPVPGTPPADMAGARNPLPLTQDVLEQGKSVFTRECLVCHGDAGRGKGPYRAGLQPPPPDFADTARYGTADKPIFTDADYFWRISEGVPWTAMPTWKLHYGETDRWALVHYVRALLTRTETPPPVPKNKFRFPDIYKEQRFPKTVNMERGKAVFTEQCAHCHGLALDGQGWDGLVLTPKPRDFRTMRKEKMTPQSQGEHLAKVTFGVYNSAMPRWAEFMPESQRWDAIKYLMAVTMMGLKKSQSSFKPGTVDAAFATLSRDRWVTKGGNVISPAKGAQTWKTYCATCHGPRGKGNGPGTLNSASPGPSPLPANMTDGYVYWRIVGGVPGSTMPGFTALLDDEAIWNVTAWTVDGGWNDQPEEAGQ
ncbi:c-type cytochrome [Pseudodesulfovibrio karagichevae]|uniref:C-type cytochrome n=1 Tax=Pseudodesulfovibrio karagichevae TaxID=3239305 RepID=A0ABV4K025_9BACT